MGIRSFNKGLDDAYMGYSPKNSVDIDYNEGYQLGEDINAKIDYEIGMEKEYEEYIKRQIEEDFKKKVTS